MRFVGALTFLLLAVHAVPAAAYKWTDAEIRIMPNYCQARYSKNSDLYEQWSKIIGPAFIHTHHYCDGLGWLNRYYGARSSQEKKRILQGAYGSFMYMVPRVDQTYQMQPELYLNLGTVLSLMKKDGEALQAMLKAIELDPKLTRAYTAAANHYVKLKKKDEALKLTTEGLRQIPDNANLQRLYVKLGGQLPYPEPAATQEAAPLEAAAQESAAESGTESARGSATISPQEPNPGSGNDSAGVEVTDPPKIGSPSNPWCRFCPPESVQ